MYSSSLQQRTTIEAGRRLPAAAGPNHGSAGTASGAARRRSRRSGPAAAPPGHRRLRSGAWCQARAAALVERVVLHGPPQVRDRPRQAVRPAPGHSRARPGRSPGRAGPGPPRRSATARRSARPAGRAAASASRSALACRSPSGRPALDQAARSHSTRKSSKPGGKRPASSARGPRSPPWPSSVSTAAPLDGQLPAARGGQRLDQVEAGDGVVRILLQRPLEASGPPLPARRPDRADRARDEAGDQTTGVVQRRLLRPGGEGRLQVGGQRRVGGPSQFRASQVRRQQGRLAFQARPAAHGLLDVRPFRLQPAQGVLPQHLEADGLHPSVAGGRGDPPPPSFMRQVVLQQRLQIVVAVADALARGRGRRRPSRRCRAPGRARRRRRRPRSPPVALAPDAAVEGDAGPAQQVAVAFAEDAACGSTTRRRPARRARRPSQGSRSRCTAGLRLPTNSTSMSRRGSSSGRPMLGRLGAVEDGGPAVVQALATHDLDAGGVGQHPLAQRQDLR